MELIGQKEALADAGPYRVRMYLEPFAAKQLEIDPSQPIVVKFDEAEKARTFQAIAKSKTTQLTLPWGPDKHVVLQPSAWKTVILETPQGVIVTPGPLKLKAGAA